jgi:hypothetical protein
MTVDDWVAALNRVRSGETLRAVAAAYGVSTQTLSARNKCDDVSRTVFGPRYYITTTGAGSSSQSAEKAPAPRWAPRRVVAVDEPLWSVLGMSEREYKEMIKQAVGAREARQAKTEAREALQAKKAAGGKRPRGATPVAAPVPVGAPPSKGVLVGAAGGRKRAVSRAREGKEAVVAPPAAKRRKVAH